jgi:hypothetical protein
MLIGAMTLKTVLRKNGPDVTVELNGIARTVIHALGSGSDSQANNQNDSDANDGVTSTTKEMA